MHDQTLHSLTHSHDFAAPAGRAERRTLQVLWLSVAMMIVEIGVGTWSGSMALLADGWHMATHVAAFGVALFAYRYARRHRGDPRFSFGTGKVGVLGGFASSVVLAFVALLMIIESSGRLFVPQAIQFEEAMWVAVAGLIVNLGCGWLLKDADHGHGHSHGNGLAQGQAHAQGHGHAHGHVHGHGGGQRHEQGQGHEQGHGHEPAGAHAPTGSPHRDPNLAAAYLHVLADAMTSVLAIVALLGARYLGWIALDPAMGLLGALLILRWARPMLAETAALLLDAGPIGNAVTDIRSRIETGTTDRVSDLHVWHVAPGRLSAALSVVTHGEPDPQVFRRRLDAVPSLAHVIVEVHRCRDVDCRPTAPVRDPAGPGEPADRPAAGR